MMRKEAGQRSGLAAATRSIVKLVRAVFDPICSSAADVDFPETRGKRTRPEGQRNCPRVAAIVSVKCSLKVAKQQSDDEARA